MTCLHSCGHSVVWFSFPLYNLTQICWLNWAWLQKILDLHIKIYLFIEKKIKIIENIECLQDLWVLPRINKQEECPLHLCTTSRNVFAEFGYRWTVQEMMCTVGKQSEYPSFHNIYRHGMLFKYLVSRMSACSQPLVPWVMTWGYPAGASRSDHHW